MHISKICAIAFTALTALPHVAIGHTWVERTMRVAPNGTMVGKPGFERSHFVRAAHGEGDTVWMIPPDGRPDGKVIHPDDKIVRPAQRALTKSSYSDKFDMLKAAPGDFVALQYQENGHVTLTSNNPKKPLNGGTVYVYATTNNDLTQTNLVDVHLSWTADGKGGDGKGKLIATRNFDDGQCYQINSGPTSLARQKLYPTKPQDPMGADLWCQADIQIPSDVQVGKTLSLIYIWDWPTMSVTGVAVPPASYYANDTKSGAPYVAEPQLYTSVLDVKIVDSCDKALGSVKGPGCNKNGKGDKAGTKSALQFAQQSNFGIGGVRAQLENNFQVAVPQADSGVKFASEALSNIAQATGTAQTAAPIVSTPTGIQQSSGNTAPTKSSGNAAPQQSSSSSSVASNTAGAAKGGVATVTVVHTQPAQTVFITETVTAGAVLTARPGFNSTKTSTGKGHPVTPTAFLPSKKIRRGSGEWFLGHE